MPGDKNAIWEIAKEYGGWGIFAYGLFHATIQLWTKFISNPTLSKTQPRNQQYS